MAEKIKDILAEKNEFMLHNGIRPVQEQRDFVITELDIGTQSLNPYGIVHGGALFTMMDVACGMAARTDGQDYVTLDSSVQFCRSSKTGKLHAHGKVVHRGRTICLTESTVYDQEGVLLAKGSFTMYRVEHSKQK